MPRVSAAGAFERLRLLNAGDWQVGKLHMVKPDTDPEIPWTALVVGLWIPNFFYWGLNQYITQRTLGSKSLAEVEGLSFDAVVTMGCGDACPWVPAKRREDWALADPRHMDDDGYRAVRDEIARRVQELLASLA